MALERKRVEVDDGDLSVLIARRPSAPRLIFGHANGFNAGTYRLFLSELADQFEIIAPDLRGHGLSQVPVEPGNLRDWQVFGRDLALACHDSSTRPTLFVGHSMGSVCGLLAAAWHGLRVDRFALIEPIFMPSWFYAIPHIPGGAWAYRYNPMSTAARKRRSLWGSRSEAIAHYKEKPLFERWQPGVLEDYLDTGVIEHDESASLACAPEWEAAIFASHGHNPWSALRELHAPVSILKSVRRGSTVYPVWRLRRHGLDPDLTQASHLAPMEDPIGCADWVRAQAADLLRA